MKLRRLLKRQIKKRIKRLVKTRREHPQLRFHLQPKNKHLLKARRRTRANPTKMKKRAIMMRRSLLSWNRSILRKNVPFSKRRRSVRRNGSNR